MSSANRDNIKHIMVKNKGEVWSHLEADIPAYSTLLTGRETETQGV
jgi:hypothetical protein